MSHWHGRSILVAAAALLSPAHQRTQHVLHKVAALPAWRLNVKVGFREFRKRLLIMVIEQRR